eukprot:4966098-Amphidinium_carterae.1
MSTFAMQSFLEAIGLAWYVCRKLAFGEMCSQATAQTNCSIFQRLCMSMHQFCQLLLQDHSLHADYWCTCFSCVKLGSTRLGAKQGAFGVRALPDKLFRSRFPH